MFLKPFTITDFGKNVIVLPEDIIYEQVKDLTEEEIKRYISSMFSKYESEINQASYYQVILWAVEGHLNADIWSFELRSWDYNTDISVKNFTGLALDKNASIITNRDGLLLLAEIERKRVNYANIDDFMKSFSV